MVVVAPLRFGRLGRRRRLLDALSLLVLVRVVRGGGVFFGLSGADRRLRHRPKCSRLISLYTFDPRGRKKDHATLSRLKLL